MLRDINMLWIGDSLSPIEQLSICSYLEAGHTVNLFSFGRIEGVPERTQIASAQEFMTQVEYQELKHRKTNSFSLAADLFRYRLMRSNAGFWSDSDFVCLRPVDLPEDNVFGWENDSYIANGFLYLAPDSPVLRDLLDYFHNARIPPWLSASRRRKLRFRKVLRLPIEPANLPWGTFGPKALTWLAKAHGVADEGQPVNRFYAHSLANAQRIFEQDYRPDGLNSKGTLLIHLWNERIRAMKHDVPEPDSLLAEFYNRYSISVSASS